MEIPPPTAPVASSTAMPALNPIDQKLLKRALHAGRNLSVLALLATFVALGLIAAVFLARDAQEVLAVFATTMVSIASGYWLLAVAARRGNPNAVGVVIVAMVLQICLVLISTGIAAARTNTPFQPPVPSLFIPILILLSLASSRKVLMQLKERQLWDRAFGSAKPSGSLCLIGGSLLAAGFIAMNAGTFYVGWRAGLEQRAEFEHANAFVELIQGDEQEFLQAMEGLSVNRDQKEIESVLATLGTLEEHFAVLKAEAASADQLLQILTMYGNALRQWKSGLILLKEPNADADRVQQMFELGDRLRAEACREFDQRYAPKNP